MTRLLSGDASAIPAQMTAVKTSTLVRHTWPVPVQAMTDPTAAAAPTTNA